MDWQKFKRALGPLAWLALSVGAWREGHHFVALLALCCSVVEKFAPLLPELLREREADEGILSLSNDRELRRYILRRVAWAALIGALYVSSKPRLDLLAVVVLAVAVTWFLVEWHKEPESFPEPDSSETSIT